MIKYIKKSTKNPTTGESKTKEIVLEMLKEIERGEEERVIEYAKELDKWTGKILLDKKDLNEMESKVPNWFKKDIEFCHDRVKRFAESQLASCKEFEVEISPGTILGQRLIPMETAGCYVPGGRYAHVASAVMSITTAKVAGVKNIIACSPPKPGEGINPAIAYTMNLCGVDHVLALGGVQGIAAMANGLFTGYQANILVGPGNRFVAEAKQHLFGKVGIDLFAGPTEIAIIADGDADPRIVAYDLVGQAEHGLDSPAWLFTNSEELATKVLELVPGIIEKLPQLQKEAATASWRDYGEVVFCSTKEELVETSDKYAPEHLEVQTNDDEWYLKHLKNYGSLFLGEETTVAYGDKCSGTNHILPTKGAGKYTGGLSVGKFIKTLTYQKMTKEANKEVGAVAARISRIEGMEGHALTGDVRLEKYFPEENFSTDVTKLGK